MGATAPTFMSTDLEQCIKNCEWMRTYIIQNDTYAQNLYAALCNNEFQRRDIIDVLTGKKWSCTWRYAGGIIADIRQSGSYIDWYCSGIAYRLDEDLQDPTYIAEGTVTPAIRLDLGKIGWSVLD